MNEIYESQLEYLLKVLQWTKDAPDTSDEPNTTAYYVGSIEIICEGERMGWVVDDGTGEGFMFTDVPPQSVSA